MNYIINFAIETTSLAGGKLNAGQELIAESIKAGLEFVMFAMRIATDRGALNSYFMNTKAGNAVVEKVKEGYRKSGHPELVKKMDDMRQRQLLAHTDQGWIVDMISKGADIAAGDLPMSATTGPDEPASRDITLARGYEHTSELVENTGMSMADSIGDTSPSTVQTLFEHFRTGR